MTRVFAVQLAKLAGVDIPDLHEWCEAFPYVRKIAPQACGLIGGFSRTVPAWPHCAFPAQARSTPGMSRRAFGKPIWANLQMGTAKLE